MTGPYRSDDLAIFVGQVLLDGVAVGRLSRNGPANLTLDAPSALTKSGSNAAASVTLEIVVEAVGRSNQGWRFDTKGLSSPDVRWNGMKSHTEQSVQLI